MTPAQARIIMEAFGIDAELNNEEEVELMEAHNPELLDAYHALQTLAHS